MMPLTKEYFGENDKIFATEKELLEGSFFYCVNNKLAYGGSILFDFKYIERVAYTEEFIYYAGSVFGIEIVLIDGIKFHVEYNSDMEEDMYITKKDGEVVVEKFTEIVNYFAKYTNNQHTRDRIEYQLEQIMFEDDEIEDENVLVFRNEAFDFLNSHIVESDSYNVILFHLGVLSIEGEKKYLFDEKEIFTRIVEEDKFEEFLDYYHNCGWSRFDWYDNEVDALKKDAEILKIKNVIMKK